MSIADSELEKDEFARDMRIILGEHCRLWVARNRIGGLHENTSYFDGCLAEYAPSKTYDM